VSNAGCHPSPSRASRIRSFVAQGEGVAAVELLQELLGQVRSDPRLGEGLSRPVVQQRFAVAAEHRVEQQVVTVVERQSARQLVELAQRGVLLLGEPERPMHAVVRRRHGRGRRDGPLVAHQVLGVGRLGVGLLGVGGRPVVVAEGVRALGVRGGPVVVPERVRPLRVRRARVVRGAGAVGTAVGGLRGGGDMAARTGVLLRDSLPEQAVVLVHTGVGPHLVGGLVVDRLRVHAVEPLQQGDEGRLVLPYPLGPVVALLVGVRVVAVVGPEPRVGQLREELPRVAA
jgi:hypothetical protein